MDGQKTGHKTTRTLGEVAQALGGTVFGDAAYVVTDLVHPRMAQSAADLILVLEPDVWALLPHSPVKAAVVPEGMPVPEGVLAGYVTVPRPRYALAILLDLFNKPVHAKPGIHPMAVVEASASVHPSARLGAFVYVGENAVVGANTILMPHVTIGAEAQVGEGCLFHPGVRVGERVVIGHRVILQHNASIGADGFSYVTPEAGSIESAKASGGKIEAQNTAIVRMNSLGTVILEDDVEIGACATIDRSTLGATRIKKGTKIDNLVMIGHNNTVGENCMIVSQVGIAGSCTVGDRVVIAGQAGLADHVQIGDDSIIMAQAGVTKSVAPKSLMVGSPAVPRREFAEALAYTNKLKQLHQEVKNLKARLSELEATQPLEHRP